MPHLVACGSYHPPHCSADKHKRCFFPSKTACPTPPKFSIFPSYGPAMSPTVTKMGTIIVIHHVITITSHPGRLSWPYMFVLSHGVHNVDPESQVTEQVYCIDHSGFGWYKLVQIAGVRLYCAAEPSGKFRRGTLTMIIFREVSLLTRGTFGVSFDNHNRYFLSCECYNFGQFRDKIMVVNVLPTNKCWPRQWLNFWQSTLASMKGIEGVKQLWRGSPTPIFDPRPPTWGDL